MLASRAASVSVLVLLWLGASWPVPAQQPEIGPKYPHVVLITVDTLRADHLSSYGYHLRTSPVMDQLAAEGVRFDRAYTPIPMTGPAHFSMFTGRYPQEHGARINGVSVAGGSKFLTVPQILGRFGYTSGAFVSAWPLLGRLTRLDRHFDHYDEELVRSYQLVHSMRWAEDVTPPAMRWLEQNQGQDRIFLWVHYFDPHEPYNLRTEFADPETVGTPHPATPDYPEEVSNRIRRYDSEIGYADAHIGRLLDKLDRLGMRDDTLVVLISDHGEGLGEHSFVGHGRWLYESTVRVPWIMRLPGQIAPGAVVEQSVSTLDLAPTLLDLVVPEFRDESQVSFSFAGRSQVGAIGQESPPGTRQIRFLSFEGKKGFAPTWISWIWRPNSGLPFRIGKLEGARKMVWTPDADLFEIFDLARDPLELNPSELTPDDRSYPFERDGFHRWYDSTDLEASETKLSKRDQEALESLGYIVR